MVARDFTTPEFEIWFPITTLLHLRILKSTAAQPSLKGGFDKWLRQVRALKKVKFQSQAACSSRQAPFVLYSFLSTQAIWYVVEYFEVKDRLPSFDLSRRKQQKRADVNFFPPRGIFSATKPQMSRNKAARCEKKKRTSFSKDVSWFDKPRMPCSNGQNGPHETPPSTSSDKSCLQIAMP